jgi:plasmid stabilization system protein ParE
LNLDDLPPQLPRNLSRRARADLFEIIGYTARHWGLQMALTTASRLIEKAHDIGEGTAAGHRRSDMATRKRLLFVLEPPWLLAYRPETRQVVRIVHGARDFPALFRPRRPR